MIWLCYFVGKIHSSDGNTFSRFQLRYPCRKSKQLSPDFLWNSYLKKNTGHFFFQILDNLQQIQGFWDFLVQLINLLKQLIGQSAEHAAILEVDGLPRQISCVPTNKAQIQGAHGIL